MMEATKMAEFLLFRCCIPEEERRAKQCSRRIDKQIAKEKMHFKRTIKILLLGSGESGKSTFIKQMRIIHGRDFQEDEVKAFKPTIYGNIMKGMKVLVDARDKLKIPWGDNANVQYGNMIFSYDHSISVDEVMFLHYLTALKALWEDSAVKAAFDRRREFQLVSNV